MSDRIRVVIADDHTIFRSGVRQLLEANLDIEVVGEAENGFEALRLAEHLEPDVILMDIAMPDMDGMEATRRLKAHMPSVAVLVLTMHNHDEYFFEMLKAGASGYVLKGDGISDLMDAIRIVNQGKVFLNLDMTERLVNDYLKRVDGDLDRGPTLSDREKEVLRLTAEGFSSKEIAQRLSISSSTVHSHHSNIMNKLKLTTRHELIQYANERGLTRDF